MKATRTIVALSFGLVTGVACSRDPGGPSAGAIAAADSLRAIDGRAFVRDVGLMTTATWTPNAHART